MCLFLLFCHSELDSESIQSGTNFYKSLLVILSIIFYYRNVILALPLIIAHNFIMLLDYGFRVKPGMTVLIYNLVVLSLRELVTTETEEKAMAAPAIAGLRTIPKMG